MLILYSSSWYWTVYSCGGSTEVYKAYTPAQPNNHITDIQTKQNIQFKDGSFFRYESVQSPCLVHNVHNIHNIHIQHSGSLEIAHMARVDSSLDHSTWCRTDRQIQ